MDNKTGLAILREWQNKFYSNQCMVSDLEESSNQKLVKDYQQLFFKQCVNDKQIYNQILLIQLWNNDKTIPVRIPFSNDTKFYKSTLDINETETSYKLGPDDIYDTIVGLEKAAPEKLNSELINVITFSLLPSLYYLFCEEKSFNKFCRLISKLNAAYNDHTIIKDLHFLFSRAVFLSPLFLNSLNSIFAPILKPIYSEVYSFSDFDVIPNFISDFQKKLIQSLKGNLCHLPSYILSFFSNVCSEHSKISQEWAVSYMKESLFNPLIENPLIFHIVDSKLYDSEDLLNKVKSILKTIFSDDFIDDFTSVILANKTFDNSLLSPKELAQFHEVKNSEYFFDQLTSHHILSTIDLYAIELMVGNFNYSIKDKFMERTNQLKYYKSTFSLSNSSNLNPFLLQSEVHSTDSNLPWVYFKRLLRSAPPLPNHFESDDGPFNAESFLRLIDQLLVQTGDPFTSFQNKMSYDFIAQSIGQMEAELQSEDRFIWKLDSLITQHDEEKRAAQIVTFIMARIDGLKLKKDNIYQQMQSLFIRIISKQNENIPPKVTIPQSTREAEKDTILVNAQFRLYYDENNKIEKVSTSRELYSSIIAQRFYRNFHFNNFLSCRPELLYYDILYRDTNFNEFAQIKESNFKSKNVRELLMNLRIFDQFRQPLIDIFSNNDDPVSKALQLAQALDDFRGNLIKQFGNSIGEDELTPICILMFAYINPPHFISNSIYMLEYISSFIDYIETSNSRIQFYFPFILSQLDRLRDMDKQLISAMSLVKSRHKHLDLSIMGNDNNLIVKLYNDLTLILGREHYKHLNVSDFKSNLVFTSSEGSTAFKSSLLHYVVTISNLNLLRKVPDSKTGLRDDCNGRIGIYILNTDAIIPKNLPAKQINWTECYIKCLNFLNPFIKTNDFDYKILFIDADHNPLYTEFRKKLKVYQLSSWETVMPEVLHRLPSLKANF